VVVVRKEKKGRKELIFVKKRLWGDHELDGAVLVWVR
jgi:hypothetical protein